MESLSPSYLANIFKCTIATQTMATRPPNLKALNKIQVIVILPGFSRDDMMSGAFFVTPGRRAYGFPAAEPVVGRSDFMRVDVDTVYLSAVHQLSYMADHLLHYQGSFTS
jgi:hypothetical protein